MSSTGAVLSGQGGMTIGKAVGSNTFNVLFILGVAALIVPLAVHRQVAMRCSGSWCPSPS